MNLLAKYMSVSLIWYKSTSGTLPARISTPICQPSISKEQQVLWSYSIFLANKTFESCKDWYANLRDSGEDAVEIILIGNKLDLEEDREVSTVEAQQFAKENNFQYLETSVLMNSGIKEAFALLLNKIISNLKKADSKSVTSSTQVYNSPANPRREYSNSVVLKKSLNT